MTCKDGKPVCAWSLLLMGAGWFLLALFVGETELLSILPGPATQITLAGLTLAVLAAFWISSSFRARVDQVDLRVLILFHLVRFAGMYFLWLEARGALPGRFAIPAGWGDVAVASGALVLLLIPAAYKSRWAVLVWNTAGLIEIILAVSTAAGLAFADPHSMNALTRLPLSFLPTMIVPLIIASHVVIFVRLLKRKEKAPASPHEQPLLSL